MEGQTGNKSLDAFDKMAAWFGLSTTKDSGNAGSKPRKKRGKKRRWSDMDISDSDDDNITRTRTQRLGSEEHHSSDMDISDSDKHVDERSWSSVSEKFVPQRQKDCVSSCASSCSSSCSNCLSRDCSSVDSCNSRSSYSSIASSESGGIQGKRRHPTGESGIYEKTDDWSSIGSHDKSLVAEVGLDRKKQLDDTLKKITSLEEQQQLQEHQMKMMEYAVLLKNRNASGNTTTSESLSQPRRVSPWDHVGYVGSSLVQGTSMGMQAQCPGVSDAVKDWKTTNHMSGDLASISTQIQPLTQVVAQVHPQTQVGTQVQPVTPIGTQIQPVTQVGSVTQIGTQVQTVTQIVAQVQPPQVTPGVTRLQLPPIGTQIQPSLVTQAGTQVHPVTPTRVHPVTPTQIQPSPVTPNQVPPSPHNSYRHFYFPQNANSVQGVPQSFQNSQRHHTVPQNTGGQSVSQIGMQAQSVTQVGTHVQPGTQVTPTRFQPSQATEPAQNMYNYPGTPQNAYCQTVPSQNTYSQPGPEYSQNAYSQPGFPQSVYGQPPFPQNGHARSGFPQGVYNQPVGPQHAFCQPNCSHIGPHQNMQVPSPQTMQRSCAPPAQIVQGQYVQPPQYMQGPGGPPPQNMQGAMPSSPNVQAQCVQYPQNMQAASIPSSPTVQAPCVQYPQNMQGSCVQHPQNMQGQQSVCAQYSPAQPTSDQAAHITGNTGLPHQYQHQQGSQQSNQQQYHAWQQLAHQQSQMYHQQQTAEYQYYQQHSQQCSPNHQQHLQQLGMQSHCPYPGHASQVVVCPVTPPPQPTHEPSLPNEINMSGMAAEDQKAIIQAVIKVEKVDNEDKLDTNHFMETNGCIIKKESDTKYIDQVSSDSAPEGERERAAEELDSTAPVADQVKNNQVDPMDSSKKKHKAPPSDTVSKKQINIDSPSNIFNMGQTDSKVDTKDCRKISGKIPPDKVKKNLEKYDAANRLYDIDETTSSIDTKDSSQMSKTPLTASAYKQTAKAIWESSGAAQSRSKIKKTTSTDTKDTGKMSKTLPPASATGNQSDVNVTRSKILEKEDDQTVKTNIRRVSTKISTTTPVRGSNLKDTIKKSTPVRQLEKHAEVENQDVKEHGMKGVSLTSNAGNKDDVGSDAILKQACGGEKHTCKEAQRTKQQQKSCFSNIPQNAREHVDSSKGKMKSTKENSERITKEPTQRTKERVQSTGVQILDNSIQENQELSQKKCVSQRKAANTKCKNMDMNNHISAVADPAQRKMDKKVAESQESTKIGVNNPTEIQKSLQLKDKSKEHSKKLSSQAPNVQNKTHASKQADKASSTKMQKGKQQSNDYPTVIGHSIKKLDKEANALCSKTADDEVQRKVGVSKHVAQAANVQHKKKQSMQKPSFTETKSNTKTCAKRENSDLADDTNDLRVTFAMDTTSQRSEKIKKTVVHQEKVGIEESHSDTNESDEKLLAWLMDSDESYAEDENQPMDEQLAKEMDETGQNVDTSLTAEVLRSSESKHEEMLNTTSKTSKKLTKHGCLKGSVATDKGVMKHGKQSSSHKNQQNVGTKGIACGAEGIVNKFVDRNGKNQSKHQTKESSSKHLHSEKTIQKVAKKAKTPNSKEKESREDGKGVTKHIKETGTCSGNVHKTSSNITLQVEKSSEKSTSGDEMMNQGKMECAQNQHHSTGIDDIAITNQINPGRTCTSLSDNDLMCTATEKSDETIMNSKIKYTKGEQQNTKEYTKKLQTKRKHAIMNQESTEENTQGEGSLVTKKKKISLEQYRKHKSESSSEGENATLQATSKPEPKKTVTKLKTKDATKRKLAKINQENAKEITKEGGNLETKKKKISIEQYCKEHSSSSESDNAHMQATSQSVPKQNDKKIRTKDGTKRTHAKGDHDNSTECAKKFKTAKKIKINLATQQKNTLNQIDCKSGSVHAPSQVINANDKSATKLSKKLKDVQIMDGVKDRVIPNQQQKKLKKQHSFREKRVEVEKSMSKSTSQIVTDVETGDNLEVQCLEKVTNSSKTPERQLKPKDVQKTDRVKDDKMSKEEQKKLKKQQNLREKRVKESMANSNSHTLTDEIANNSEDGCLKKVVNPSNTSPKRHQKPKDVQKIGKANNKSATKLSKKPKDVQKMDQEIPKQPQKKLKKQGSIGEKRVEESMANSTPHIVTDVEIVDNLKEECLEKVMDSSKTPERQQKPKGMQKTDGKDEISKQHQKKQKKQQSLREKRVEESMVNLTSQIIKDETADNSEIECLEKVVDSSETPERHQKPKGMQFVDGAKDDDIPTQQKKRLKKQQSFREKGMKESMANSVSQIATGETTDKLEVEYLEKVMDSSKTPERQQKPKSVQKVDGVKDEKISKQQQRKLKNQQSFKEKRAEESRSNSTSQIVTDETSDNSEEDYMEKVIPERYQKPKEVQKVDGKNDEISKKEQKKLKKQKSSKEQRVDKTMAHSTSQIMTDTETANDSEVECLEKVLDSSKTQLRQQKPREVQKVGGKGDEISTQKQKLKKQIMTAAKTEDKSKEERLEKAMNTSKTPERQQKPTGMHKVDGKDNEISKQQQEKVKEQKSCREKRAKESMANSTAQIITDDETAEISEIECLEKVMDSSKSPERQEKPKEVQRVDGVTEDEILKHQRKKLKKQKKKRFREKRVDEGMANSTSQFMTSTDDETAEKSEEECFEKVTNSSKTLERHQKPKEVQKVDGVTDDEISKQQWMNLKKHKKKKKKKRSYREKRAYESMGNSIPQIVTDDESFDEISKQQQKKLKRQKKRKKKSYKEKRAYERTGSSIPQIVTDDESADNSEEEWIEKVIDSPKSQETEELDTSLDANLYSPLSSMSESEEIGIEDSCQRCLPISSHWKRRSNDLIFQASENSAATKLKYKLGLLKPANEESLKSAPAEKEQKRNTDTIVIDSAGKHPAQLDDSRKSNVTQLGMKGKQESLKESDRQKSASHILQSSGEEVKVQENSKSGSAQMHAGRSESEERPTQGQRTLHPKSKSKHHSKLKQRHKSTTSLSEPKCKKPKIVCQNSRTSEIEVIDLEVVSSTPQVKVELDSDVIDLEVESSTPQVKVQQDSDVIDLEVASSTPQVKVELDSDVIDLESPTPQVKVELDSDVIDLEVEGSTLDVKVELDSGVIDFESSTPQVRVELDSEVIDLEVMSSTPQVKVELDSDVIDLEVESSTPQVKVELDSNDCKEVPGSTQIKAVGGKDRDQMRVTQMQHCVFAEKESEKAANIDQGDQLETSDLEQDWAWSQLESCMDINGNNSEPNKSQESGCETTHSRTGSVKSGCEATQKWTGAAKVGYKMTLNRTGPVKSGYETTQKRTGVAKVGCETTTNRVVKSGYETTQEKTGSAKSGKEINQKRTGAVKSGCGTTQNRPGDTKSGCETTQNRTGDAQSGCKTTQNKTGNASENFEQRRDCSQFDVAQQVLENNPKPNDSKEPRCKNRLEVASNNSEQKRDGSKLDDVQQLCENNNNAQEAQKFRHQKFQSKINIASNISKQMRDRSKLDDALQSRLNNYNPQSFQQRIDVALHNSRQKRNNELQLLQQKSGINKVQDSGPTKLLSQVDFAPYNPERNKDDLKPAGDVSKLVADGNKTERNSNNSKQTRDRSKFDDFSPQKFQERIDVALCNSIQKHTNELQLLQQKCGINKDSGHKKLLSHTDVAFNNPEQEKDGSKPTGDVPQIIGDGNRPERNIHFLYKDLQDQLKSCSPTKKCHLYSKNKDQQVDTTPDHQKVASPQRVLHAEEQSKTMLKPSPVSGGPQKEQAELKTKVAEKKPTGVKHKVRSKSGKGEFESQTTETTLKHINRDPQDQFDAAEEMHVSRKQKQNHGSVKSTPDPHGKEMSVKPISKEKQKQGPGVRSEVHAISGENRAQEKQSPGLKSVVHAESREKHPSKKHKHQNKSGIGTPDPHGTAMPSKIVGDKQKQELRRETGEAGGNHASGKHRKRSESGKTISDAQRTDISGKTMSRGQQKQKPEVKSDANKERHQSRKHKQSSDPGRKSDAHSTELARKPSSGVQQKQELSKKLEASREKQASGKHEVQRSECGERRSDAYGTEIVTPISRSEQNQELGLKAGTSRERHPSKKHKQSIESVPCGEDTTGKKQKTSPHNLYVQRATADIECALQKTSTNSKTGSVQKTCHNSAQRAKTSISETSTCTTVPQTNSLQLCSNIECAAPKIITNSVTGSVPSTSDRNMASKTRCAQESTNSMEISACLACESARMFKVTRPSHGDKGCGDLEGGCLACRSIVVKKEHCETNCASTAGQKVTAIKEEVLETGIVAVQDKMADCSDCRKCQLEWSRNRLGSEKYAVTVKVETNDNVDVVKEADKTLGGSQAAGHQNDVSMEHNVLARDVRGMDVRSESSCTNQPRPCGMAGNVKCVETDKETAVKGNAEADVLVIGDFIMEKAHLRAKQLSNTNLELKNIEWHTSPDACLDQKYLKRKLEETSHLSPIFIIIHLGANDLMHMDHMKFCEKANTLLKTVREHRRQSHIIWSSMPLHCLSNMNFSIKQIDAARIEANKTMRDQVMNGLGFQKTHMISYDRVFKRSSRALYESDGQDLSQKGVDRFLTVMLMALEEFMRNPMQKFYPSDMS